jgi:O-antigen/teichoic acid export membrane protein
VSSLLEISGKMSFANKVIQSPESYDRKMLGSLQVFQLVCSSLSAALMVVLSWPLAAMLKKPELDSALRVIALTVFIEGVRNLCVYRNAKTLNYGRIITMDSLPQFLTTLAAYPLCLWLRDYHVILWLSVGRTVLSVALSHLFSQETLHLSADKRHLKEIWRFGFPLYISGLVFALNAQGDRGVVGSFYSLADLGTYAVAVSLVLAPGYSLCRVIGSLGLPMLAKAQDSLPEFIRRYKLFAQGSCIAGTLFAAGFYLFGAQAVKLAYGSRYANGNLILAWMALGFGFRIASSAVIGAAMAKGDTVNLLTFNLFRLLGVGAAFIPAYFRVDLQWVAAAGAVFEGVALVGSSWRFWKRHGVPVGSTLFLNFLNLGLVAACIILGQTGVSQHISSFVLGQTNMALQLSRFLIPSLLVVWLFFSLRYLAALEELRNYFAPHAERLMEKIFRREPDVKPIL